MTNIEMHKHKFEGLIALVEADKEVFDFEVDLLFAWLAAFLRLRLAEREFEVKVEGAQALRESKP